MTFTLPNASRSAGADAVVDRLNAGSGPGYIEIRGTPRPAANSAATGDLLATVVLEDPAFSGAVNGVKTIDLPATVQGVDDGAAVWWRGYDSDDNPVIDGSVGVTGSGENLELNSVAVSVGVDVTVTGGTITMPG